MFDKLPGLLLGDEPMKRDQCLQALAQGRGVCDQMRPQPVRFGANELTHPQTKGGFSSELQRELAKKLAFGVADAAIRILEPCGVEACSSEQVGLLDPGPFSKLEQALHKARRQRHHSLRS